MNKIDEFLQNNGSTSREILTDRVDGEITLSLPAYQKEEIPENDTLDYDVAAHVAAFLSSLNQDLNLSSIQGLTLDDPQKANSLVNAMLDKVEQKLRTARLLQALCDEITIQNED